MELRFFSENTRYSKIKRNKMGTCLLQEVREEWVRKRQNYLQNKEKN